MRLGNSIFEIVINILCLILLIGIIIYLLISWSGIPDQIPGHFAADGTVNRWDSKGTLFIVPAIAWVLFIGITIIERFPHLWNTGVRVTEENKYRIYKITKSLLVTIKLFVVALFVSITIMQTLAQSLPVFFLPVFLSLMSVIIVYHIIRLIKAR